MDTRKWYALGFVVAGLGAVMAMTVAASYLLGSGAVVAEQTLERRDFVWSAYMPLYGLLKKGYDTGTHMSAPIALRSSDSPFRIDWRIEDGGGKHYKYAFELSTADGRPLWMALGSTLYSRNPDKPGVTRVLFPSFSLTESGEFTLKAHLTHPDGRILESPSRFTIKKRGVGRTQWIGTLIFFNPIFIVGAVMFCIGLLSALVAGRHPVEGSL